MTTSSTRQPLIRFILGVSLCLIVVGIARRYLLWDLLPSGSSYPVVLAVMSWFGLLARGRVFGLCAALVVWLALFLLDFTQLGWGAEAEGLLVVQVLSFLVWSGLLVWQGLLVYGPTQGIWMFGLAVNLFIIPGVTFAQELFWFGWLALVSIGVVRRSGVDDSACVRCPQSLDGPKS